MLKDIKISHKLALMVAIPILGLIYFTIDNTLEKREIVNQMNLLQTLSELAVKSSSLIHELQKERGMSAGFIGSQGTAFAQELQVQRVHTDNAIKELDALVKNFNFKPFRHEMKETLEIIFTELNNIESRRNLIDDFNVSVEKQIQYYITIINSLFIGINYLSKVITNAELSNQVVTYVNLLQAKEKAGLERATLNNAFSRGYFAPGMYREFILLVGAQDIYIKNFFFFATPSEKKFYRETMQKDSYVAIVEKIRKRAFKKAVRFQILIDLRTHTSYGGLIHQLNNYVLWGEPKYIDAFHQQYQNASTILELYKNLPYVSQSEIKNLEIIENTFDTYTTYLATAIALKKQQKSVEEIQAIIDEIDDTPVIEALNNLLSGSRLNIKPTYWWEKATGRINLLKAVEDQISSELKESALTLKNEAQSTFVFYLIIAGGTIFLTLFLSYFFAFGITKPLKTLVTVANKIASGDRNIKIDVTSKDETGQLSSAMTLMLHSINRSEMMLKETSQAYARFVPNEFLQLLNKDQITDIQLGNHLEMNMTVLFSDIRSFTTLSERMSPQKNFNFLNAFLKEMGPIIREHNGFIDKYIGDAIMALFINADDALNASVTMLKMLEIFNQIHQHQFSPIKIGIGLNTGKLMLGIIGEQNRLQCTVISDAVNLASRLEGITKTYKGSLIISQSTLDSLTNPSQYTTRFLDNIKVKGRAKRVNIYEVLDGEPEELREAKLATLPVFEKAVRLYQQHKFTEVDQLMQTCLQHNPHDVAAEMYLERCQNFLKIDYSKNWEAIAKVVEWTPHLLIGNQIIDEQHKELLVRVKNLIMSIGSGKTEEEVSDMISFLEGYVVTHFEIEEMYMQQYNYPAYACHKEQHQQFIEIVNKIKEDYKNKLGHLYLATQIQQEIADWLVYHINECDQELGQFLKDKG